MDSIGKKKITTLKVDTETKERIEHLRVYKRESYDEIIQKMLEVLSLCRVSPGRAQARLMVIDKERKRNLGIKRNSEFKKPVIKDNFEGMK